jgi:hypothetical protein
MSKDKNAKKKTSKVQIDEKTRKAIEESAYFRWLNRNANHGLDVDDWLEAEQEVIQNVFDRDPEE